MSRATIPTGAVLLAFVVGASCSDDDDGATPATTATRSTTIPGAAAAAATPEAAPVEVSACVYPGPELRAGTEEPSRVSLPEGEMTITRQRGNTWRLSVSDVSDPRLDGTWYNSTDDDRYTLPGGEPGPELSTVTHRIENDEGAWHGSAVDVDLIRGRETTEGWQYVLVGEGAYEGLTAVMIEFEEEACPNTRGYIIEGNLPPPPVPSTGG